MKKLQSIIINVSAILTLALVPLLATQDIHAQTDTNDTNTSQTQPQPTTPAPNQTTTDTVRETTTNTISEKTVEPAKEDANNTFSNLWPWLLVGFIILVVIILAVALSGRDREETTVVR